MNLICKSLIVAGLVALSPAASWSRPADEAKEVRGIIDKVNTTRQKSNDPAQWPFWHVAAYHTGNMEAYRLTGESGLS